jgi:hypothetical protein
MYGNVITINILQNLYYVSWPIMKERIADIVAEAVDTFLKHMV